MKEWIEEGVIKTWTDAQKNLWERLSMTMPAFGSAADVTLWQQAYKKNLDTWEAAVKQIMALQSTWLNQWARHEGDSSQAPQVVNDLTRHVHEVMQGWIQAQSQLWEEWFKAMRAAGEQATELAVTDPTKLARPAAPTTVSRESSSAAPSKAPVVEPRNEPQASAAAARAEEKPAAAKPPEDKSRGPEADDLKTLNGLGPVIEEKLNAHGIVNYRQLAVLTDEEIKAIESAVPQSAGRFERYDWVAQAKKQHLKKYGESL